MKKIKEKELDRIFSLYIRQRDRWTCQYCGRRFTPPTNELHNSHFYTRTARSVRWDESNCDAMCRSCHSFLEDRKNAQYYTWKESQLGRKRFIELRKKYVTLKHWSEAEKQDLLNNYANSN